MDSLTPHQSASICDLAYDITDEIHTATKSSNAKFRVPFDYMKSAKKNRIFASFAKLQFSPIDYFQANTGLGDGRTAAFGVIAEGIDIYGNNRKGESLITIRGTQSWADWGTNFRTMPDSKQGVHIHSGFNQAFQSFAHHIDRYLDWHSPSRIHLVGHSLGGALATLTARHIHSRDSAGSCQVKLYTFGAPRVGFDNFNQQMETLIGKQNIYRVYHDADVVSMIPMYPFLHAFSADSAEGYCLNWNGSLVSVQAHDRQGYIRSIGNSDWQGLKNKPMAWTSRRLMASLGSYLLLGPALFSAKLLSIIGKALNYILSKALGIGLGTLPGYATTLDQISWLLVRGMTALKSLWELGIGALKAILAFLGIKAEVKNPTVAFIRALLERLGSCLQSLAYQSVYLTHPETGFTSRTPRSGWQTQQAYLSRTGLLEDNMPFSSGHRPRQNAYRRPGPNNKLSKRQLGPSVWMPDN
ncbi:hypothetical protein GCM10010982_00430 [Bowmanella pacifica]|uniref:Fungal lipase-type domain-containing protein n=2 Tax=Bowmanella pacifica TaxID=502051 RepID=A0A917YPP1_9ALTE|nr:hypothetical protein GCM10010982_00430 [Bowmanella pacifica]